MSTLLTTMCCCCCLANHRLCWQPLIERVPYELTPRSGELEPDDGREMGIRGRMRGGRRGEGGREIGEKTGESGGEAGGRRRGGVAGAGTKSKAGNDLR